jgi:probable DNA metabolism protein
MKSHPYFLFDGSFAGFLNAIQKGLEESHARVALNTLDHADTLPLFGSGIKIETETQKARRLWEDLGLLGTEFQKRVYYCFLHENVKLRPEIYQYIVHLFYSDLAETEYSGIQAVKKLDKAVREVSRERDAQERVLSFKANTGGVWYSEIQPKHDILPLLSRYCRSRFPADPWLVVDAYRKKSLSSVSGKITLGVYLQNVKPESRALRNLQRVTDAAMAEKTTCNTPPARSKTSSLLSGKTKNWEAEWGQKAV